jgi:hypothetical protein
MTREDEEYLDRWRDERKGVFVRHSMVDVTGDFVAGALLSQLLFLVSSIKDGWVKGVVYREGREWLVRERTDWHTEIRLKDRQVDTALKKLIAKGFVETRRWKHGMDVVMHLSVNVPLVRRAQAAAMTDSPICKSGFTTASPPCDSPIRESGFTDMQLQHVSENHPERYKKSGKKRAAINSAPAPDPEPTPAEIAAAVAELRERLNKANKGLDPDSRAGRAMIEDRVRERRKHNGPASEEAGP